MAQEVQRWPQGGSRRPEEAPGGSRRLQEAQGGFRKPQGIPGGSRRIHEALGGLQDVPGDPGELQGAPGARRIGERMCAAPQRERNFQKTCARRRSESDILPCRARCAPRPVPAANFAKPTTRKSTLRRNMSTLHLFLTGTMAPPAWGCLRRPRGMCAASHSWHAFRIVDDKTGHVERTNVDFDMLFCQSGWEGPDGGAISRGEGDVGVYSNKE